MKRTRVQYKISYEVITKINYILQKYEHNNTMFLSLNISTQFFKKDITSFIDNVQHFMMLVNQICTQHHFGKFRRHT